jgi:hypothetical protein
VDPTWISTAYHKAWAQSLLGGTVFSKCARARESWDMSCDPLMSHDLAGLRLDPQPQHSLLSSSKLYLGRIYAPYRRPGNFILNQQFDLSHICSALFTTLAPDVRSRTVAYGRCTHVCVVVFFSRCVCNHFATRLRARQTTLSSNPPNSHHSQKTLTHCSAACDDTHDTRITKVRQHCGPQQ